MLGRVLPKITLDFLQQNLKQMNDIWITIAFWVILGTATVWWPDWYCSFKRVKTFTETELVALSPAFANINHATNIWSLSWGGVVGVILLIIFLGEKGFFHFGLAPQKLIPWVAFFISMGAFFFPSFAYFKGVYPIPKSYRYIYQPPELVRRIGRLQTALALTVMFLAVIASVVS